MTSNSNNNNKSGLMKTNNFIEEVSNSCSPKISNNLDYWLGINLNHKKSKTVKMPEELKIQRRIKKHKKHHKNSYFASFVLTKPHHESETQPTENIKVINPVKVLIPDFKPICEDFYKIENSFRENNQEISFSWIFEKMHGPKEREENIYWAEMEKKAEIGYENYESGKKKHKKRRRVFFLRFDKK